MATGGSISRRQINIINQMVADNPNLKRVLMITDNNEGGDQIADKLKSELRSQNLNIIKRHSPKEMDADWNDVLLKL